MSGCAALLFIAIVVTAQSPNRRPQQNSSSNTVKKQQTATLRANDSVEGSRVAINSNQSLADYEAYRRGDRFYVKIPPADVPHAETTRGRGFADVKVNRAADSTVISFRLQPGTTAHVEQRANKLEVVFNAPGSSSALASRPSADRSNVNARDVARVNPSSNSTKQPATSKTNSSSSQAKGPKASNNSDQALRGANDRAAVSSPAKPDKSGPQTTNANSPSKNSLASAGTPTPAPLSSPSPASIPKAISKATASPGTLTSPTPTAASENTPVSWQNRFKERARYWILMAQLNPIPVVVGMLVLALIIVSLMFQRRRLRGTRHVPASRDPVRARSGTVRPVQPPKPSPTTDVDDPSSTTPIKESAPVPVTPDGARETRVATVAEQVKNVVSGNEYDQNVIGSTDHETRQLVGAELLSALVGRNLQRRERAREAFMNHGYFDDATRDLRTADAPVERAAAARRLSFVHDREATPHLISALDDSAPEVRRTAVEALMDLRDPAAIGPLTYLM